VSSRGCNHFFPIGSTPAMETSSWPKAASWFLAGPRLYSWSPATTELEKLIGLNLQDGDQLPHVIEYRLRITSSRAALKSAIRAVVMTERRSCGERSTTAMEVVKRRFWVT